MTRLLLVAAFAVSLAACDTDPVEDASGRVLYVGNQGNFSDDNGSLTRYDLATEAAVQEAIPDLGGLVQNLYGAGNRLYVVLNFSDSFTTGRGRVDVVDVVGRARTDQIDVRVPRAFATRVSTSVGPAEVLVTNLYDGTATPINLITGAAGDPIEVGTNPEGAVTVYGRTYVANSGFGTGTTISVIDTRDNVVVETLEDVCVGPRTLLADGELDVWVICTGTSDFNTGEVVDGGAVVVLDGETGDIRTRFTYEEILGSATLGVDGAYASSANDSRREVYVIADGAVLRFDARENTFNARIEVAGAPVGAVAYDRLGDRLYLGRPDADNPYSEDGFVSVHDRSGIEVGRFGAGIAPAAFAFVSEEPIIEG